MPPVDDVRSGRASHPHNEALSRHARPRPICDIVTGQISTGRGQRQIRRKLAGLTHGRGRDEDFSSPPAQIPACAANAPGSSLGSNVGGAHGLKPQALPRTAANRIDAAFRLSVRTAAA